MKPNLLALTTALAGALLFVGCDRDDAPAAEPADTAVAPADTMPADTTAPPPPTDVAATPPGGTGEPTAPMPTSPPPTVTDSGRGFADMDTNKDGGLTRDELDDADMLDQHFGDADTDGNGALSQAEVDAHRAKMTATPPAG